MKEPEFVSIILLIILGWETNDISPKIINVFHGRVIPSRRSIYRSIDSPGCNVSCTLYIFFRICSKVEREKKLYTFVDPSCSVRFFFFSSFLHSGPIKKSSSKTGDPLWAYRAYAWFRSRKWERNKERKRQEEEEKKVHREGGNCLGMQRAARWVWVPVTQPEALFSTGDGKRKFFVNQNAVFVLLFRYTTECYAFIFWYVSCTHAALPRSYRS